ncbi:hypothetical protein G7067_01960 [Leucobacter insecticola]|uniref:Uncharacterized protein n=1 Tax=Leucobacter insecticola TaxID=2714934 RepID=A0A6G8FHE3_9MICO|nr:hypothetical protein [Leucobacter insecticola]QIM15452.1 hypothetical protein G7067_01960 [Leucobacter insecticola]
MALELTPLITGFVGAITAGGLNVVVLRLQSKANLKALEVQLSAQAREGTLHRASQLKIERERHQRQRIEEAHEQLMLWCYQLEVTMDDIWHGIHSSDAETVSNTQHLLDEWPWETLRRPAPAAALSYYWSEKTVRLIYDVEAESAHFSTNARMANGLSALSSEKDDRILRTNKVWENRGRVRSAIEKLGKTSAVS